MSDGYSDVEKQIAATDPRKLMGLTAQAAEKRHALEAAVRRSATLIGALRLALAIAGPLAGGVPGGAVARELADVGLDMLERET